jgi:deoxyribose-phosphate aldolase
MASDKIPIVKFESSWLTCPPFDQTSIDKKCDQYKTTVVRLSPKKKKEKLIKLIKLIDLTTLSGDDTPAKVAQLVDQALQPIPSDANVNLDKPDSLHCAAVCVYPARLIDVVNHLKKSVSSNKNNLAIASVAGGFPSGQYKLESRLLEIKLAVEDGATEIDIVINRCAALLGDWETVYDEIKQMRTMCGEKVHLKTIIATGELITNENIYKAGMTAILGGSDFIKTSTGKETVNATLQASWTMCQVIKAYFEKTGRKVGFKPAGGIRTADEALAYLCLMEDILGDEWVDPSLFRIGASTLLSNIFNELKIL